MKNWIGNLLGSVAAKILGILFALVGTTLAAILVSGSLISTIRDETDRLVSDSLPPLQIAAGISNAVSDLKTGIGTLSGTTAQNEIEGAIADLENAATTLNQRLRQVDHTAYPGLDEDMQALHADIATLNDARRRELEAQARNLKAQSQLNADSRALGEMLQKQISQASFALLLAGNDASSATNRNLSQLLQRDVEALKLALMFKAELNLSVGLIQTLLETNDFGIRTEVLDQTRAAHERIEALLKDMTANDTVQGKVPELREALTFPSGFLDLSPTDMKIRARLLHQAQNELNTLSSKLVDHVLFTLDMESADALSKNEVVLRTLLDKDVRNITDLARLDSTAKTVLIKAMQGAASIETGAVLGLQAEIDKLTPELRARSVTLPEDFKGLVASVLRETDPQTRLLHARTEVLEARRAGLTASADVASGLLRISDAVITISDASLFGIATASQTLTTTAEHAQKTMNGIAVIAVVIVLIAPILTYMFIMRPLTAVTARTVRLAIGDMSDIRRVGGRYGEIARLFAALSVFRNNLVGKERMETEAHARQLREDQAKAQAEKETHDREAAERARQQEQAERDHARDARNEAERQAIEAKTAAERQARHAEQPHVVGALAEGLRRLSQGDVRLTLDEAFPESYEQLRQDYNAAVLSLRSVIGRLSGTARTIHDNSGEISNAAKDLSHRTERAASMLGETAAALTQLTASVKSAADGAALANRTVTGSKSNAQSASKVVQEAISAMDAISESSDKISRIISVIDDIAFQTNLLALNAGVEAARAGEAGRGFAVVASEVRALAQRSSEAAREINTLISVSGQQVGRGVSLVDQTGDALRSIVEDVSAISQHMSEIATSAEEQSAGISEINAAVSNLDQTTQQNVAMFEQTTAASLSLTQEATMLTQIVSKFVLNDSVAQSETEGDRHTLSKAS
ncbi:methyl-accepting chemotaxis protein [Celeribacter ethanolicus]|uniref:methyl-accepting chemotaxis protein n=1 Tax=Celeribacter ethanolicus TaxID=1758178 RepID=UPI0008319031|nr:methyl-accepting chemotaxis protein [Celeribacter ethanolicus]